MAIRQSVGSDLPGFLGRQISTEFAVTGFQLASGVFGGLAALVASRRLENVSGDISIGRMLVPIGVAGISTVAGALLLPTGG